MWRPCVQGKCPCACRSAATPGLARLTWWAHSCHANATHTMGTGAQAQHPRQRAERSAPGRSESWTGSGCRARRCPRCGAHNCCSWPGGWPGRWRSPTRCCCCCSPPGRSAWHRCWSLSAEADRCFLTLMTLTPNVGCLRSQQVTASSADDERAMCMHTVRSFHSGHCEQGYRSPAD